ncbi:hypothetical protein ACJ3XI_07570 [Litorimonas sp. RW-G-Af-16]|uniref:hypothetical protein n=1 Tax=Litorimonas sp. RW-G-Af-16 TaxID=3241168 RepID=UPI00390C4550
MPRQSSLQTQLARVKLEIELARLTKLRAEVHALPKPTPQYTRYEDMPPPSPEDRKRFMKRLEALYDITFEEHEFEYDDGSEAG